MPEDEVVFVIEVADVVNVEVVIGEELVVVTPVAEVVLLPVRVGEEVESSNLPRSS